MDCTNQPNSKFPPTHPLKAKKHYTYVVSALGFTYEVLSCYLPNSILTVTYLEISFQYHFNTSPMQKKLCRRLNKSFLWLQCDHFCLASWGSCSPLEGAPSSKTAASPQLYYAASQSVVEVDPPTWQLKCNQCDFASIGGKPTDDTHEKMFSLSSGSGCKMRAVSSGASSSAKATSPLAPNIYFPTFTSNCQQLPVEKNGRYKLL